MSDDPDRLALVRWEPPAARVVLAGPDPARVGGVSATLAALRPHLGPGVEWLPVGRRSRFDLSFLARDTRSLGRARGRAELLHLNPSLRPRALLRDLWLLGAWRGPAVLWVHGWDPELAAALARTPAFRRLFGQLTARTRLIALSPGFAEALIALGAPPHAVDVVPPAWSGQPLPREPRPGTVLFLGRIELAKGVLELVRATAKPGTRLILAGEGSAAPACAALARSLGAQVELPGLFTGEAKWRALAQAEAFVLPSYEEGVPVALLEAMAAGVPAVATSVGAVPWLAEEGRLVTLIPPGEGLDVAVAGALEQLRADPARAQERAEAARVRAAAFAAPTIARALRRVWARALGRA